MGFNMISEFRRGMCGLNCHRGKALTSSKNVTRKGEREREKMEGVPLYISKQRVIIVIVQYTLSQDKLLNMHYLDAYYIYIIKRNHV